MDSYLGQVQPDVVTLNSYWIQKSHVKIPQKLLCNIGKRSMHMGGLGHNKGTFDVQYRAI